MNRPQQPPQPTTGESDLEIIFGADTMSHFPKVLAQEAEAFLATGGKPFQGEDVRDPHRLASLLAALNPDEPLNGFFVSRPYPDEIETLIRQLPDGWDYSHDKAVIALGDLATETARRVLGLSEKHMLILESDRVIFIGRRK